MSKIKSFEELLIHQVADLMSAEEQIIEALPKLAEGVTHKELKKALLTHLKETEKQFKRLEKIGKELKIEEKDKKTCKGMKGLISEGNEAMKEIPEGALRDCAIIAACQKVEHYEISGYGTARTHAELAGMQNIVQLLQETLDEEGKTDKLLTELAVNVVNENAMAESQEQEQAKAGSGSKSKK